MLESVLSVKEFLYEAYRGELFGIAFFSAFAETAEGSEAHEKWLALIELEHHTAALLKRWLERNGQVCAAKDPEMEAHGRETALPWLALDWNSLMATMAPWIEGYAIKYRDRADGAPPELYWICDMVAAHEEAILSFVLAEQSGKGDSLKAVQAFMTNYRSH